MLTVPCSCVSPYTTLFRSGVTKNFRGFRAVRDVNLEVVEGDVHALVGPNGAGKTTFFNLLTGFIKPSMGTITVFGEDRSEEHTSELQSRGHLVCRLLLEKK